ncbi:MAG TPA: 50S ribosomal protein L4 [Candidatus Acidoferrales bacterium]
MPVVDVKNLEGKKVGTIDLADDVFSAKVNQNLLHETVRHHLAGQRAGTHKTKDKSEVSGAGRKLWKQKGTGRARIGSIRSPLWRHGGTVHGPVPRSYEYALPRKMILGGLRSALSAKLAQEKMTIVDGWELESHKTKAFRQTLSKLDAETKTILLVDVGANVNLERASRNLDGVTLVAPASLGAYDLMRHDHLMLSKEAAGRLSHALSAVKTEQAASSEPGASSSEKSAASEKTVKPTAVKAAAKKGSVPKASKKRAASAKEKPKSKPKGKKD